MPITLLHQQDIFQQAAEALVNPVNTEGVMGKGLALQFRRRFPAIYGEYLRACRHGQLRIGAIHVVESGLTMPRLILHFPTKRSWRRPSHLTYIEQGTSDLRQQILLHNITSIAIPPLGCGLGGLHWTAVKPILMNGLNNLKANVLLLEPY